MKKGQSLEKLAIDIKRLGDRKRDFITDTRNLYMSSNEHGLSLDFNLEGDHRDFAIQPTCHRQIGSKLGIPAKYYDKMLVGDPELLCANVNAWFASEPSKRMVRTYDKSLLFDETPRYTSNVIFPEYSCARAFLGEKYRPLDDIDLFNAIMPRILDKGALIRSASLTESALYIHASFPDVQGEVEVGDVVESGIIIKNSEIGQSSLSIQPWINRLVCSNGMIVQDSGIRKYHTGRMQVSEQSTYELLRDETKRQSDKAFWMQVCDLVDATLDKDKFENIIQKYRSIAGIKVGNPVSAVEEVTKMYNISEDDSASILDHFARGESFNQWTLANSVTHQAHDEKHSYERCVDFEEIGGKIMELPSNTWN